MFQRVEGDALKVPPGTHRFEHIRPKQAPSETN